LSLVLGDDFRAKHIATVSKTNVGHLYQLGRKIEEPAFRQLVREVNAQTPIKQAEVPARLVQDGPEEAEEQEITLEDLLGKAEEYGIAEAHMAKAAARYCRGKSLSQLNAQEIEMLYDRLVASREAGPDEELSDEGRGAGADSRQRAVAGRQNGR
jgi:hypothetical protein